MRRRGTNTKEVSGYLRMNQFIGSDEVASLEMFDDDQFTKVYSIFAEALLALAPPTPSSSASLGTNCGCSQYLQSFDTRTP